MTANMPRDSTSDTPVAIVVDDDFLTRLDIFNTLENVGFQAFKAENADEATGLLERLAGAVDLLFTDVKMPGSRNGFALAREVARRWPRIGIVITSGTAKHRSDDIPEGATFIAKPFSTRTVDEHLCKVLTRERRPVSLRDRA